jgi:hypothetical protein
MDTDSTAGSSPSFWDKTASAYQNSRDSTRYGLDSNTADGRQKYDETCLKGSSAEPGSAAFFAGGIPGAVVGAAEGLWDNLF